MRFLIYLCDIMTRDTGNMPPLGLWKESIRTVIVAVVVLFIAWSGNQVFNLFSSYPQSVRKTMDDLKATQDDVNVTQDSVKAVQESIKIVQDKIDKQQSSHEQLWRPLHESLYKLDARLENLEKYGTAPQPWLLEQLGQARQDIEKMKERFQHIEQILFRVQQRREETKWGNLFKLYGLWC